MKTVIYTTDVETNYGRDYLKGFVEFVESLGFTLTDNNGYGQHDYLIEGLVFEVFVDNMTTMWSNAYNRSQQPRKPQNRFAALKYGDSFVFKIFPGKEYDGDKLTAKVKQVVADKIASDQAHEDHKNKRRVFTTAVAVILSSEPIMKKLIKSFSLDRGVINIHLKDGGWLSLNSELQFEQYSFDFKVIDPGKLREHFERFDESRCDLSSILESISLLTMPSELVTFIKEDYRESYDMQEQKYYG